MKIRKRSGKDVDFDRMKIVEVIQKANEQVGKNDRLSDDVIDRISRDIETECKAEKRLITSAEVQDKISLAVMKAGGYKVALSYTGYRHKRELRSKANTIDDKIMAIVDGESDEAKGENSNKNPTILPTQRDYIAGEVSRDMTRRYLLPPDIMAAHDEGRIHFHDADYFIGHVTNCELVNLDDMLQNGTVITNTLIEKPHRFSTACNIATQVIAQVASSTYGKTN